jgi:hypothetical protein
MTTFRRLMEGTALTARAGDSKGYKNESEVMSTF